MPEEMPDYATNIALIKDGVVENIIWGMIYGLDSYADDGYTTVAIDDLAVRIGDTYNDGHFYNSDGEIIKTFHEYYETELFELDNFIINSLYSSILEDIE